jgi:hypothetical protein
MKALPVMQSVLGRSSWLSADFVQQREVEQMLRSWSARSGEPFTTEAGNAWRLLRDVAALDAWLGQVSC